MTTQLTKHQKMSLKKTDAVDEASKDESEIEDEAVDRSIKRERRRVNQTNLGGLRN